MTDTTHDPRVGSLRALTGLATSGALWRRGRRSPDDIVDTLADIAPGHRVAAADPDAAAIIGVGAAESGTGALLRAVRTADRIRLLMPAAGDTCGITDPAALAVALEARAVLVLWTGVGDDAVGIVVRAVAPGSLSWTAHHLGEVRGGPVESLGDVEYELRQAVRDAAELFATLDTIDPGSRSASDLRTRLTALIDIDRVELPPEAGDRIIRVMDQATQVAAIVTLVGERTPAVGMTAGSQDSVDAALERLRSLTRTARMTAVNTIISELERSPH
ncbi:serine/threonine protein kinase [Williamsia sp. MIQD14]|uniref:serine/threonine protein kinase n=1 Tax=Williamsia sp. MIQD14 TaxID=3425703 RepID=UPI003DA04AD2